MKAFSLDSNRRYYFLAGLFGFAGLLILAVIFFKERIAFCDTAYQAVYLLIEQRPYINMVRAGSIIPQLIPLTAIWLHAGLRTVMILHSLSFIIFFLATYLIGYRYSTKGLVFFAAPIYLLLLMTEVFYWPQSELQQGMLWLCLYAVFLYEGKWQDMKPWQALLLHFIFILWVQFFHPLIFFPIVFLIIYYFNTELLAFSRKAIALITVCIASFVIRYAVGIFNPYEKGKLNIGKAIRHNLPHLFRLDSVHSFASKLPSAYFIYACVVIGSIAWLTLNKKYIKAASLVSFSLGYWLLIMITSPEDARFYTENMLLPLSFIAVIPLVVDILPSFRTSYALAACLFFMLIRLGLIYHAHRDYTARYTIYDPYLSYLRGRHLNGVFVNDRLIDQKKAMLTWGSGYETILLTSLASPDSCRIVQMDANTDRFKFSLNLDTSIVTIYGVWDKSRIPDRYFRLRGGGYEIIEK